MDSGQQTQQTRQKEVDQTKRKSQPKEIGQTKRKIQYVAKSTYVISLPKPWIENTIGKNPDEVKKQNLIIIPMQDGSLAIYPEQKSVPIKSETVLRLTDELIANHDFFRKRLIAKYLAGYNRIRLICDQVIPTDMAQYIEDIVRMFIGCEIVEISSNQITIQDLLALGQLPIAQALNMMALTTRSATKSALHSLVTNNKLMAREVSTIEDKVDRYHYLITRQLNSVLANPGLLKEHNLKLTEVTDFDTVVNHLELIGDHAEGIAKTYLEIIEFPEFENISETDSYQGIISIIKELNTKLTGISNKAIDGFFEKDIASAYATYQECTAIKPVTVTIERLSDDLPINFQLKLNAIAEKLSRMADKYATICETAMDRAELV